MNIDNETVRAFGDEWTHFAQDRLQDAEAERMFNCYFHIFPWSDLPANAEGFDMGCGSGRWARRVASRVGVLNCIDPSTKALEVARRNLRGFENARFLNAGVSDCPVAEGSQDFGYSLGVLHHIPDTEAALKDSVRLLKRGAPFLLYLYYRFDNKPKWYAAVWRVSNFFRSFICKLEERHKLLLTDVIAYLVYFPMARAAKCAEKLGVGVQNWPLSPYRNLSLYTMRTDSRDRFGTPLEQRFTRSEIQAMMSSCGLEQIRFSEREPFWCAVGVKA